MASAKKKLDEYHLKILRQLVTLPVNKECFDCHQRGPTYVNVTIGSFVCTTCSGMLRGLTPPHRVKSISMATFTPEEVDFVKARGNDYCRRTWLGLLDTQQPTKDEQQIKDFMIAKYERKRYYLDPAVAATLEKTVNGSDVTQAVSPWSVPNNTVTVHPHPHTQPTTLALKAPASKTNSNKSSNNVFTPEPFADFSKLSIPPPCDPFNSPQASNAAPANTQTSFADFDNNPVFSNSSSTASLDIWAELSTLSPIPMRPVLERAPCPPSNRWSMPGPVEDRYAALKDLDCLMKSQAADPPTEWSTGVGVTSSGTNVWPASTLLPPAFTEANDISATSNPFKGNETWNNVANAGANPFRNARPTPTESAWQHMNNGQSTNGFPTSQSLNFAAQKVLWNNEAISNPFVLVPSPQTASHHHSSNPFL